MSRVTKMQFSTGDWEKITFEDDSEHDVMVDSLADGKVVSVHQNDGRSLTIFPAQLVRIYQEEA